MPEFIHLRVQPKGDDGMPHPRSSDRVFYPRAIMTFHAQRRSTVSVF